MYYVWENQISYQIWGNVSDGERVFFMGRANQTLVIPGGQDTGLDHEAELGGLHKAQFP